MKLGYAQTVITPTRPMRLVGFVPSRVSTTVHSDLHAKAVTLNNKGQLHGFFVTDLLGNTLYLKERVITSLADHGIHYETLDMMSTHTHSGPVVLSETEYHNPKHDESEKRYFDFLVEQIVSALSKSVANADEFTFALARGQMRNFQSNRTDFNLPADRDILSVEVCLADHKILLYSFAGHPTILNRESTAVSSDYVGIVDKHLLSQGYDFVMFFNAPCGDMSTRFHRRESSIAELERLGKIAASCVIESLTLLGSAETLATFDHSVLELTMALKDFNNPEELAEAVRVAQEAYDNSEGMPPQARRVLESRLEGALVNVNLSKRYPGMTQMVNRSSVLRLNDYQVYLLASEVFSALVAPLKEDENTWCVSLSDQYNTYLVTEAAFETGTYEAQSSAYKPGEGERLMAELRSFGSKNF